MSFEGIIHAQRMHTGDFFGGSDSDHDAFDARVAAEVEETLERMDTSLAGRNELQEAVERSDAADVQALAQDQEMEATEALLPPAFKKRRTKKGAAESGPAFNRHFHEWKEIADNLLTEDHRDELPNDAGILVRVQKIWHFVREQQDSWPDELVRLGGAAILVYGMRLGGKVFIGDLALLLWLVGGESHVRIHKGICYLYNAQGAFLAYTGKPPEHLLDLVATFFLRLEGIFRRLPRSTRREDSAILSAIARDRRAFPSDAAFLQGCKDAAVRGVVPTDDVGEAAGADVCPAAGMGSWTEDIAGSLWKVCQAIRSELMQDKLFSVLVEWCESEDRRQPCVCYMDVAVTYDKDGRNVSIVPKCSENNCYVYIPHKILDPVPEEAYRRLTKFYRQTFWCNNRVFLCHMAAIALAKRGHNIDRCFIGVSPGGAGQSLYSTHLDAMYGPHHTFFDPNVWYNDEELRKQVENFASCFIITGQEAPDSQRKFHLDLYKKTMSADGIAGRKPYGYTTRMFAVVGWKRLETNRMIRFQDVSEENFRSVLRRGFVWGPQAAFHQADYLTQHCPRHEEFGVFCADPTLKQFLVSSEASVAGLKLQAAFEKQHNKESCQQLIEEHAGLGGDGWFTETKLREACGLPPKIKSEQACDGLAALDTIHTSTSQDDATDQWTAVQQAIMDEVLISGREGMTLAEFKKLKLNADGKGVPNVTRDAMWKTLQEKKLLLATVRNSTSTEGTCVRRVQSVETCIPCLRLTASLSTIVDVDPADQALEFPEAYDVGKLRANQARAAQHANEGLLLMVLKPALDKKAQKKGRGKLTDAEFATMEDLRKKAQKVKDMRELWDTLADESRESREPLRRRLPNKGADPQRHAAINNGMMQRVVSYSLTPGVAMRGRRYVRGWGAQRMTREIQECLLPHTVDLDIHNCCFVLLKQLFEKLNLGALIPAELNEVLVRCADSRASVCTEDLGVSPARGKLILNTVLNGGRPPKDLLANSFLRRLQSLSVWCRWLACSLLPQVHEVMQSRDDKTFPTATVFHHLWTCVEDCILQRWAEYVLEHKPTHLSLHFDGIRVNADVAEDREDFIRKCEEHVLRTTSFRISIREKRHFSCMSLLRARVSGVESLSSVPATLLNYPNSIPCALWHISAFATEKIDDANHRLNCAAQERGRRTYREVAELSNIKLHPLFGLPTTRPVKFLLHLGNNGSPCCIGVDASDKDVSVFAGEQKWHLSSSEFSDLIAECTDRATLATFAVSEVKVEKDSSVLAAIDRADALLDLQAGADHVAGPMVLDPSSPVESDDADNASSSADDFSLPAPAMIVDDAGEVFFQDDILTSLKQELENHMAEVKAHKVQKQSGMYRCCFCPFRSFERLSRLVEHLSTYHVPKRQYAPSGTKQIKVILALHDADCMARKKSRQYLSRSAELLRTTVLLPLKHSVNEIDRHLRLVFTGTGPEYRNIDELKTLVVRRVRNIYYTKDFAEQLYREIVLHHSNVAWSGLQCLCLFVEQSSMFLLEVAVVSVSLKGCGWKT